MARDEEALREFSLVNGGDDVETREMLGNELDQFMGQQGGGEGGVGEGGVGEGGEGGGREGGEGGRREGGRREGEGGGREGGVGGRREGGREGGAGIRLRPRAVKRVDPGMSVLQDSVLGMRPDGKANT